MSPTRTEFPTASEKEIQHQNNVFLTSVFCYTSVPGGTILVSYSWTRRTADILEFSAIPEEDINGTGDSKEDWAVVLESWNG